MKRIGMQESEVLPDRSHLTVSAELRGLVRDLPMAAAVLDADGHAWIWNAAAELLFPPPPQISHIRYPMFSLAGQPWFATARASALQGRSSNNLPWRLRGLGGTHYRIGVSLTPVRAENGAVTALLAVLQDTTTRDRAYRRSVQRARRSSAVLDHLPDPVLVHRGGRIVYANRPALRLFGASTKRQLVGRELDACVMPLPNGLASLIRARSKARVQRLDGTSRDAELQSRPFVFRNRKATNVTLRELPMMAEMSTQTEFTWRTATEGCGCHGVILLDAIGQVQTWTSGSEALTGFRADEIHEPI